MRVALLQMTSGIDPVANCETLVEAIEQAARGGADMLFTPEMSNLLDRDRARSEQVLATEAEDRTLAAVRAAAKERGVWVHLGSLALADDSHNKRFNRGFLIDPQGEVRARYDKIHLFDVDLPSGETWRESSVYRGGDEAVLASTPWGGLGMTICYDLRFPELFSSLSNAGAAILSVPAAFTVPTGKAHWHVLLRARAIEAAGFVVATAQCGAHEDGRHTYGHSLVIDPWGTVILDAGEEPGLYWADLDLSCIDDVRARIPVISHRKSIKSVTIS